MRIACVTMSISRRAIPSPLGLSRGRVAILSKTGWSARGCVGRSRVRKRCWTCAAPTLMGIGTTSCGIALRRKPNVCTRIAISSNQLKLLRRGSCRSRHEVAESSRSHPQQGAQREEAAHYGVRRPHVLAGYERAHVRHRAPRTAPRQVNDRDVVERDIAQEAMDFKAEAPKLLPRDSHPL